MAGCFGNSKEDRYFERQLDRYLDEQSRFDDVDENGDQIEEDDMKPDETDRIGENE